MDYSSKLVKRYKELKADPDGALLLMQVQDEDARTVSVATDLKRHRADLPGDRTPPKAEAIGYHSDVPWKGTCVRAGSSPRGRAGLGRRCSVACVLYLGWVHAPRSGGDCTEMNLAALFLHLPFIAYRQAGGKGKPPERGSKSTEMTRTDSDLST